MRPGVSGPDRGRAGGVSGSQHAHRLVPGIHLRLLSRKIPEIHWSDHNPAILSPDGGTIEWSDVRPEDLPRVFATHRRVCWNCHVAQSFRAQFPGLAVERPERTAVKRAS